MIVHVHQVVSAVVAQLHLLDHRGIFVQTVDECLHHVPKVLYGDTMHHGSESIEAHPLYGNLAYISVMQILKLSCIYVYGFKSVLRLPYRDCKVIAIMVAEFASIVELHLWYCNMY